MDLELFFGRFHPLVVHLPIGFLLLAAILEALSVFAKEKFNNLQQPIAITLLCSGFGAAASAGIGYLLAEGGGYDEDTLFWHKWLGIGLAVLSFLAWAIKTRIISLPQQFTSMFILGLVVLVSITGHLGGNLTHGSDYLFAYAPNFVKKVAGVAVEEGSLNKELPKNIDSVQVFTHLVRPMLETKCFACHSETKSNGGLLLSTKEGLEKGGDTGKALVAGDPFHSPLFLRTTLPQNDVKFMPPKGEPLTYSEMKILKWWIESGGEYDFKIKDAEEIPKEIEKLLLRDYGLDTKPKPYYDAITVTPLSEDKITAMVQKGWSVKTLGNEHAMLDVNLSSKALTQDQLSLLKEATEQITWLDLADKGVTDEMLTSIGQLPNLTRLELNNNAITDQGLQNLKPLQHIEVLNLYGTEITDEGLAMIGEMKSLKRVYLWQTQVTAEGIKSLTEAAPELKVIGGVQGS